MPEASNIYHDFRIYIERFHPSFFDETTSFQSLSLVDIWSLLAKHLKLSSQELASVIAKNLNLSAVGPIKSVEEQYLEKLPHKFALQNLVVPIESNKQCVVFATANPFNQELEAQLKFSAGRNIEIRVAVPEELELHIAKYYSHQFRTKLQPLGKLWLDDEGQLVKLGTIESREIPTLARNILVKGMEQKASDMHLQPLAGSYAVRFRIDGVLHRVLVLPEEVATDIIRYFKSKAGMDPTTDVITQDGQMSIVLGERNVNLRLSILPLKDGQRLVIRFLDQGQVYNLANMGFSLHDLHALTRMISECSGLILVTGPTGSGKTTTLYSLLSEINREDISIITVENPVEYEISGISQVEINPKAGLTFAAALRSILRQDPEVILIGEIRDSETAQIAMQAALTGHLVLATLHTNDAITSIPRLVDLGISPPILAESLKSVISQRLLRKLCEHCREPVESELLFEEALFQRTTHVKPPYRAKGCQRCQFSGFNGRIPIMELFESNEQLRQAITNGTTNITLLREALGDNMLPISVAASKHVISGATTIMEAARVIGVKFWSESATFYQGEAPTSTEISNLTEEVKASRLGILVLTKNLSGSLHTFLENAWFDVHATYEPKDSEKVLRDNPHISIVIADVPEELNEKEIIDLMAEYRTHLAWSLLPAIIMLPANRPNLESALRKSGTTSRCVEQPISNDSLYQCILEAL